MGRLAFSPASSGLHWLGMHTSPSLPVDLGIGQSASAAGAYRAAKRREAWRAFALAVPLLLFLIATFVFPIGALLWRSVQSPEVGEVLPRLSAALRQWDGSGVPGERVFAALADDIRRA